MNMWVKLSFPYFHNFILKFDYIADEMRLGISILFTDCE